MEEAVKTPVVLDESETRERREAMQLMAQITLSEARNLMEIARLNPEPKGANFAWVFFGTEMGKGYTPSYAAIKLQALAEGKLPPDFFGRYTRLEQEQDPTARIQLEQIFQNESNYLVGVSFHGLNSEPEPGLISRFGGGGFPGAIPHNLTNYLLQRLGFLNEGEEVKDPIAEQSGGRFHTIGTNLFEIPHLTLPFIAECRAEGSTPKEGPRFEGFNIRYTLPTKLGK